MDYAEARAAFFAPREGEVPALDWSTPARRLRDAIEPLATICFWSEPSYDAYAALGLDFLLGYAWGRASVLGDVEPPVAAAAFGVFDPDAVAGLYSGGRAQCSLTEIRAARVEGVRAAMHAVLGDPSDDAGAADAVTALRAAAAATPTTGRALFAGWTAMPRPEDPWVQLWHVCSTLRELRGDGHLAALVAAGLDGTQANLLTESWVGWEPLAYTGTRAWSPEAMAAAGAALEARGLMANSAITEDGRRLRREIETATDLSVAPTVDALGERLDPLVEQLSRWSQRVIDHGWFPADPLKRASG